MQNLEQKILELRGRVEKIAKAIDDAGGDGSYWINAFEEPERRALERLNSGDFQYVEVFIGDTHEFIGMANSQLHHHQGLTREESLRLGPGLLL